MIYLLIFLFFLLGYIDSRSKFSTILLFVLLLIISVSVQAGYDINNYAESYNLMKFDLSERSVLFTSFMMISNSLGLSFSSFRLICFLIWSIAIFTLIRRYSELPNYTIVCCFLFPLLSFSSQIRNGVAVGFIYIALLFLFKKKNFINILFFTLFILIATAFHKLSALYFICIVAVLSISTKKLLFLSLIMFFTIMLALFSGLFQNLIYKLSPGDYYIANYIGVPQFDLFIISGLFFIVFFYTYLSCRSYRICDLSSNLSQGQKNFSTIVCRINIIFLLFLPLLLISGSFFRIYQNIIILSIIAITNASTDKRLIPHEGRIDRLFYFLFFMMASVFYIKWQGGFFDALNSIVLF